MKQKLTIFIGLFIVFLFNLSPITIALDNEKKIIYLYSEEVDETLKTEFLDNGIDVKAIDVSILDNMKYLYLYEEVYDIPENSELPIIISGDHYYINEDINSSIQDIVNNSINSIKNIKNIDIKMVVYFYSPTCTICQATKSSITELENRGVHVVWIDLTDVDNIPLFESYGKEYGFPKRVSVPMAFSGDKYYHKDDIINHLNEIEYNASNQLKEVGKENVDLGIFLILLGGLIDGVNPCAIAMLVLFIGLLLGTKAKKKTLIGISFAYIFGLFITYFSLGAFLLGVIDYIEPYISDLSLYLGIFIIIFSVFLFIFNLHDYIVSKNEEYGKIKNQLPKGIQKFNKRIIKIFTNSINNKNIVLVYIICFSLGVIISLTEFLCTGQVYLPILLVIRDTGGFSGLIKLLLYNIMFIVPLTVLAIIAIKAQSAMETSDQIRKILHIIKLVTAILFLLIAIYYIFEVLGILGVI